MGRVLKRREDTLDGLNPALLSFLSVFGTTAFRVGFFQDALSPDPPPRPVTLHLLPGANRTALPGAPRPAAAAEGSRLQARTTLSSTVGCLGAGLTSARAASGKAGLEPTNRKAFPLHRGHASQPIVRGFRKGVPNWSRAAGRDSSLTAGPSAVTLTTCLRQAILHITVCLPSPEIFHR